MCSSTGVRSPNFFRMRFTSSFLPVRKVHPGRAWNAPAYFFSTSGVSRSGSMLIE